MLATTSVMKISVPTEKGKTMTALEYMKKQLQKHCATYVREVKRGAPKEDCDNILLKIRYYAEAMEALLERDANG